MSEYDEIDPTITNRYPNEYLNSLDPLGLPTFKLELKVGCPIILLRNIAPKDGLCNGTRLMVNRIESKNLWSLKGEIRLACFDGDTAEHWLSTGYYVLFDI
ncbi:hypothetical protein ACSBR1_002893 [Camellia fascicularis]